ncbi:hypothetical protein F5884DRAFT_900089 [Xylogone sp. PMI_703]|nr:hypothetical protein F5884DRAFT_900089 [Xylogone sp. PMI_703]
MLSHSALNALCAYLLMVAHDAYGASTVSTNSAMASESSLPISNLNTLLYDLQPSGTTTSLHGTPSLTAVSLTVDGSTSPPMCAGVDASDFGSIATDLQECCPTLSGFPAWCLPGAQCDPTNSLPAHGGGYAFVLAGDSDDSENPCTDPPDTICGCDNPFSWPLDATPESLGLCRSTSIWQCCGDRGTEDAFWCPTSASCGTNGSCNGTAAAQVLPSYDTFNSIGCYGDLGNSRTLRNGSLISDDMSVEECIQFGISGGWQYAGVENGNECYVGNTILNEAEPQGCNTPCAGAPDELCGGNSRINIYQDSTWQQPSLDYLNQVLPQWILDLDALQQAVSAWYNLLIDAAPDSDSSGTAKKRDSGASTGIEAAYSNVVSRRQATQLSASEARRIFQQAELNGIVTNEEVIEMQNLSDMTDAVFTSIDTVNPTSTDFASQLKVAVDVIKRIGARAVIAATSEEVLLPALGIFLFAAILYGETGGGTPTTPPPPATTPTGPPSGTPTPYYLWFTEDMTQAQYDQITASIVEGGGSVLEQFTDPGIKWYSFNAEIYDAQMEVLVQNPLLEAGCLDVDGTLEYVINKESDEELGVFINSTTGGDNWKSLEERNVPNDVYFLDTEVATPSGFSAEQGWPFHLQWLSGIWAKNNLAGNFADTPLYARDGTAKAIVYVLDTGIDSSHQEFRTSDIPEAHDYTSKPGGIVPFNSMTDDATGHGTMMASLVGGSVAGVNREATIIPVKITLVTQVTDSGSSIKTVARAMPGIIKAHSNRGNPQAVINMSFSFDKGLFGPSNIFLRLISGGQPDPFRKFLRRLNQANIVVALAAGNGGRSDNNNMANRSPARYGGTNTNHIIVGAVDQNGIRADFSNSQDTAGAGYLSVYTNGVNIVAAQSGSGTFYRADNGTSQATAITSGLISILLGQGAATVNTAKSVLRSVGTAKKGLNWPADMSSLPVVPRTATNFESSCPAGAQFQPVDLANYPNLPNQIYQFSILNTITYAQATAAGILPCVSVQPHNPVQPNVVT